MTTKAGLRENLHLTRPIHAGWGLWGGGDEARNCSLMDAYSNSKKEHWLGDKREQGRVLVLEDGSWWEVRPQDRGRVWRWLRISTIRVENPKQGGQPYLLTNTMEDETIQASYIGKLSNTSALPGEAA